MLDSFAYSYAHISFLVRGIEFPSFYNSDILLWNCSYTVWHFFLFIVFLKIAYIDSKPNKFRFFCFFLKTILKTSNIILKKMAAPLAPYFIVLHVFSKYWFFFNEDLLKLCINSTYTNSQCTIYRTPEVA
jgi:hypothetical protein